MLSLFTSWPAILPIREEGDLVDWILKIVIGVFFVGIPLVKGILQSREKAKQEAQPDGRRAAREKEIEGRRAFEELMRGEPTMAPPPVPDSPPRAPSRAAEAVTARAAEAAARGTRAVAPKPLTEREEISATPLTGSEFEAQEGAPEADLAAEVERRDRDELRRQEVELRIPEEIAREEYAASSSLRENVEPVPVEVFRAPALEVAGAPSTSEASRRLLGAGGGADRRTALRRALVLNEVLGRPVSARDGSDASTPVGLRG